MGGTADGSTGFDRDLSGFGQAAERKRALHKAGAFTWTSPDRRASAWEAQAAYYIDGHPKVEAFVKNAGLGFTIPYVHDGRPHDFVPDFIVRLSGNGAGAEHLVLETKGFDELAEVKQAAAERWVAAVNAAGSYGR